MCGYNGVGWRRQGKAVKVAGAAGGIISMVVRKIFCSFFFARRAGGIGLWRGHATQQLPTTIVTRFCGHTEFLRAKGYEKGRVQNLNSNPAVCKY